MNNSRRKYIIVGSIAIVFVVAISIAIHYFTTTATLKISFTNTKSVTIVEDKGDTVNPEVIGTIKKSPSTIRVPKEAKLYAHYTGDEGYADGSLTVNVDKKEVTIDPDYSKERYNNLMNSALPKVTTILQSKYANVETLYTISSVEMIQKGKWYVVRLNFKGEYGDNSDTLRALFQKSDDGWKLVAGPDIIFTSSHYPNTDETILKWANEAFVK